MATNVNLSEEEKKKKQAEAAASTTLQKPTYNTEFRDTADTVMNQMMNREKFTYDLNGDALYNQYKDQYVNQGKMAMMDTIGQASAMTGGYGNSYAQAVGQQTYQGYLQNLNDKVPELYQMALNQYNQEGQDLLNLYSMLSDRAATAYNEYRDATSDYFTERDFSYQQQRDEITQANTVAEREATEKWNQLNYDLQMKKFDADEDQRTIDNEYRNTVLANEMAIVSAAAEAEGTTMTNSEWNAFTKAMQEYAANGDKKGAEAYMEQYHGNPYALAMYHAYFGESPTIVDTTVEEDEKEEEKKKKNNAGRYNNLTGTKNMLY